MEVIKKDGAAPIFSWCPVIENSAKEQMEIISNLPFAKYCALMPDAHWGNSMCIGGVVACDNVVVPNFVGSDVGCGVGAIKTSLHRSDLDEERCKKLLHSFSRSIPVGFHHNSQIRVNELENKYREKIHYSVDKTKLREFEKFNPIGDFVKASFEQLGTLGGGNHFLEIQYDEEDCIWVMVHSGSRNMGKKTGDYFNGMALDLNKKWYSECRDTEIPFLPADSEVGRAYLAWMDYALRFAFLNRMVMLEEVKKNISYEFYDVKWITHEVVDDSVDDVINIHHNFASLENHFGKNYWTHRKGATMARNGLTGIIPGSMGTSSYIVKGLGNKQSMQSCSHGAGRRMGRMAFCREMEGRYDEIESSLKGVVHSEFSEISRGKNKGKKDVSESPGAYKDIEDVMSNQTDLVKPIVKLTPMICLKG